MRKIDICLKDDEECGRLWRGVVKINRLIISAPEEPIKIRDIIIAGVTKIKQNLVYIAKETNFLQ